MLFENCGDYDIDLDTERIKEHVSAGVEPLKILRRSASFDSVLVDC